MADYTEKSCSNEPYDSSEVLVDDNLIPIPPKRPSGTIRARLKRAEPDKPGVFEDEIPLTSLDDL
jgi:hypothetical protein